MIPGIANEGVFHYGTPALLWLLEKAIFPGVASNDIYLHPVARGRGAGARFAPLKRALHPEPESKSD